MNTIESLLAAVQDLYAQGSSAYWLPPIVAFEHGKPVGRIRSGDSVIFCCRRGEREIQLTEALSDPTFHGFPRELLTPLHFVPLVQYHPKFESLPTAFSSEPVDHTLGEEVSRAGFTQLRMAETEKFAHVTYFLNGKHAEAFPDEYRISVPSNLADPLVSLRVLVERISGAMDQINPTFTAINLATGDLLGHSDQLNTKMQCASAVDDAVGQILRIARARGMWTVITADHGLLEDHGPPGGPINSSHTTHRVPFFAISPDGVAVEVAEEGSLADVAPTILRLLGVKQPDSMMGTCLLRQPQSQADRVLLLVLDGWGIGDVAKVDPIALAPTPNWDLLLQSSWAALEASGGAVGLIDGTKGNSESGHMTIGAGRAVTQDDAIIDEAIHDGSYSEAPAFLMAMESARSRKAALHLIGLLSRTSSHGSVDYALELARLAATQRIRQVYLHLITDGRSSRSERLPFELQQVGEALTEIGAGSVVTLVGRGYALDRGGAYETNTRPVYEALVDGKGIRADI